MTDPARIYLVRHGEAAASWGESPDPGLSELGHRQAEETSLALQAALGSSRPRVISSPLLRAQETAAPLQRLLQLEVAMDERFREIPSPVPLSERQTWLREFMRGQWAEQSTDLQRWRKAIVGAIAEQDPTVPTVIFTHFLVINALAGFLLEREATLVFWPDNASITTIGHSDGQLCLESLGQEMQTVVN